MKTLAQTTTSLRMLIAVNADRLLMPLCIVGALTVAGWLLSYATVH